MKRFALWWLTAVLCLGCEREASEIAAEILFGAAAPAEPSGRPERVRVEVASSPASVAPRFLSFAIDSASLVGAPWWSRSGKPETSDAGEAHPPLDFGDARLARAVRALAPAYLRVGGTDADRLTYAMDGASPAGRPGEFVLDAARWDALTNFAREHDLPLIFTVNAGPISRDDAGAWRPETARALIEHAQRRGDPVAVWELGNEVDLYWQAFGLSARVSGGRYAKDFAAFTALAPPRRAGPASAYWPLIGELLGPTAVLEEFLELSDPKPEVITWHYYPQQSRRCTGVVRRVRGSGLLGPSELDELARQFASVARARDRHAPAAEIWLGETGGAQCGGEPGVSDRYVSALWWLDELGLAARLGNRVVVRQTLVGSDYGLLHPESFALRPDAWASWLWKRFMGERVLAVETAGENAFVRAYAHCAPGGAGALSLLLLNVHATRAANVNLDGVETGGAQLFALDAPSLDADVLRVNSEALAFSDGSLPTLRPRALATNAPLPLPPASAAFLALSEANAPACR